MYSFLLIECMNFSSNYHDRMPITMMNIKNTMKISRQDFVLATCIDYKRALTTHIESDFFIND